MSDFTNALTNINPILANVTHRKLDHQVSEYPTMGGIAKKRHFRWNTTYTLSPSLDFRELMNIAFQEILHLVSPKLTGELSELYPHIAISDPVATNITKSEYHSDELMLIMHPEYSHRISKNSPMEILDFTSQPPRYLGVPFTDHPDIKRVICFNKKLSCVVNLEVSISYEKATDEEFDRRYNFTTDIRGLFLMVNMFGVAV